jgi:hypothetical protein
MKNRLITLLITCLLPFSGLAVAESKSVTIRGDTESPTVLYLVPWKKTVQTKGNTDFDLEIDFEFQPLSRSEVIREVRYFKELGYDKLAPSARKKAAVIRR